MARKSSYSAVFKKIDGGYEKEYFDYKNDEYGKIQVINGKENVVAKCSLDEYEAPEKNKTFFVYDTKPKFNVGLGCVTEGTRHAEKIAKKRGLEPIGDAPLKTVARQFWPDHPLTKGM